MQTKLFLPITLLVLGVEALAAPPLEEVIVTASRVPTPVREVGAAVSVIGAAELQLRGYANLADLLRTEPSIGVSNQGGPGKITTLRIRGEEGYRTLFLLDGLDLSDPSATQSMTHVQHLGGTGAYERVEILRGPQGFIYGADAGGVVNILTRTPEGAEGGVSIERGSYASERLEAYAGQGGELGHVFVAANRARTDGFNAFKKDEALADDDGYDNTTWHAKAAIQLADAWRSEFVARTTKAENEYDQCGGSNDCYDTSRQKSGRASLRYRTAKDLHTVGVTRTDIHRSYITAGFDPYAIEGDAQKLDYLGSRAFSEALTWVWGADYETERLPGEGRERHQTGVFSELQSAWRKQFYLAAGVRFDENNEYGDHTSVRLAPAYWQQLPRDWQVKYRASYGTGFRAPSLSELAFNSGPWAFGEATTIVLTEEQSEGFDAGVEFYGPRELQITLGYFDQHIKDEIVFDPIDWSGYLQLDGISHSKGWEAGFAAPITTYLQLEGSYTYNETLTEDDQPRVRRPKHLTNLALFVQLWQQRVQWVLNWRSARDALTSDRAALPDYEVVDLALNFAVNDRIDLYARLENALDETYVEVQNYNTAERSAYAGARLRF